MNLKRKASGGDQPTKYLVSEAVGGLGYESRAKLGCQLSSLNRMVQRSRKAANRHPSNPRDLETLSIPANYILSTDNEPMMLWDSGWDERTRRSFLWGTPKNADHMVDAEHWVSTRSCTDEDSSLIQHRRRLASRIPFNAVLLEAHNLRIQFSK